MRKFIAATVLAAAAITAAPALAQSTVVRASGPSVADYPVGKQLDPGQRVVLETGDSVTVLEPTGTRVLKGPGRFLIGGRATAERDVLGTFIARRGNRERVRLGVVRGDVGQDGPIPAPTVWLLESGDSGPFCLAGEGRLFVWRPENSGAARLSIKAADGGATTSLGWEDGSRISAWPQDAAPTLTGSVYTIAMEGGNEQADVTFVRLDNDPPDLPSLVAALANNGCSAQIERLIAAGGGEQEENPPQ